MPSGVENAGLFSDADGSAATRAINERLQRLEELQTRQLEHQIQEAKERAEFKRWWIRQQKHQLREQERAMQAPPTLTRQSPAAASPNISRQSPAAASPDISRQSPAAASPGISSEKGKSIPGKSLAKNSPGTFQDCQSNISMGETEEMGLSLTPGTEEAAAEASSDMPPAPEATSSSTFQRFLRTVTRSKQSLSQVDGNLSDDEMSNCDDPSYQPNQDEMLEAAMSSSTEESESDFFTDDSCTEDEASQRSFKSKCSRDQGPILYKHFLLLKIELN